MQKRTETTEANKRKPKAKTDRAMPKVSEMKPQQEERHWVVYPQSPDKLSTKGKIAWFHQELKNIDDLIKHIDRDIEYYPPGVYSVAHLSRSYLRRYAHSLFQRLEKEKLSLALQEQPANGKVIPLAIYRKNKQSVMREQATPQELEKELLTLAKSMRARSERMLAELQSIRKKHD